MNEKKLRKKQQPKNKKQKKQQQKTRQIMPPEIPVHRNEKKTPHHPSQTPFPQQNK